MFDTGPQFVFNLGGGPGVRVHQFGGNRPRRRPQQANGEPAPPANLRSTIANLLPLLILFVLPLLSSLFSGSSSTPAGPQMRFAPEPPYTKHHVSSKMKLDYYVNPAEVMDYSHSKLKQLDYQAEVTYVQQLSVECETQLDTQRRLVNDAQGWFFQDELKMQQARNVDLRSCRMLDTLGFRRSQS
jgi:DnaJ family protein B protein 12